MRLVTELGRSEFSCPVCQAQVPLRDPPRPEEGAAVAAMESAADAQRDRAAAVTKVKGKVVAQDFDVFLCHNAVDKAEVTKIANALKERGILPWLDVWELRPGVPWQPALEKQIKKIKAAAVFVGKNGVGPWQEAEIAAFLRQFVKRHCPVIPVILPGGAKKKPRLPVFLDGMGWVDFRVTEPDPMDALMWGVTGQKPRSGQFE